MTVADSQRKKAAAQRTRDAAAADEAPENTGKVRDMLLGGQMRAVDQRMVAFEDRIHREITALRADTDERLIGLEA